MEQYSKPFFNILLVADTHSMLQTEELERYTVEHYLVPDAIITLGDVSMRDFKVLRECFSELFDKQKIYGILGNHDGFNILKNEGVQDIHGKKIEIAGKSIVGWQGSNKYKSGKYPCMTQKESIAFFKNLPSADILISHDRPKPFLYEKNNLKKNDIGHSGLVGIRKYCNKNKIINIHGHYHQNYTQYHSHFIEYGIYRLRHITIESKYGYVSCSID